MFNDDFFPTPKLLGIEMWAKVSGATCCLEPSAGKGDLADAGKNNTRKRTIDTIEPNPELRMILKGKGYPVVSGDFLSFVPTKRYDAIVMNPPFSNCVDHVLKAWEIVAPGGKVVTIIPETAYNYKTKKNNLLMMLCRDHGTFVSRGSRFFMHDVERKTKVGVGILELNKPEDPSEFGVPLGHMARNRKRVNFNLRESLEDGIAKADLIDTLENEYREAVSAYKDFLVAKNRLMFYTKHLAPRLTVDMLLSNNFDTDEELYNGFVDNLNKAAWGEVFDKTEIRKYITDGVSKEFESYFDSQKIIDFSRENIQELLHTLRGSVGNIIQQAAVKVFDELTQYDKRNRVHVEGWKSNDFWRVNKKVVVPGMIEDFCGNPHMTWGRSLHILEDLDRVMCSLSGKDYDKTLKINEALYKSFHEDRCWDLELESEFFKIRYYRKGTVHLVFKDLGLLEKFNKMAADGKGWLPGER